MIEDPSALMALGIWAIFLSGTIELRSPGEGLIHIQKDHIRITFPSPHSSLLGKIAQVVNPIHAMWPNYLVQILKPREQASFTAYTTSVIQNNDELKNVRNNFLLLATILLIIVPIWSKYGGDGIFFLIIATFSYILLIYTAISAYINAIKFGRPYETLSLFISPIMCLPLALNIPKNLCRLNKNPVSLIDILESHATIRLEDIRHIVYFIEELKEKSLSEDEISILKEIESIIDKRMNL